MIPTQEQIDKFRDILATYLPYDTHARKFKLMYKVSGQHDIVDIYSVDYFDGKEVTEIISDGDSIDILLERFTDLLYDTYRE